MNTVLVCEDSLEGIFTGIYEAFAGRRNPQETIIQTEGQDYRLFSEYISVRSDERRTAQVAAWILKVFGEECYHAVCRCLATQDGNKGQAVYQTVAAGLSMRNPKLVLDMLQNEWIRKVFELNRRSLNEIVHLRGFLRFQELEQGILFARIGPQNNILTFLTPHFADRFPMENFIIFDEIRQISAVHPAGKDWILISGQEIDAEKTESLSQSELAYQELFTFFCHKIAIRERCNIKLQKQMLPLRFREYMHEFK